jgi:copper/silver efflux system protein
VLAVPFSAVGAIWLLYLLDYNMSIGVWVGLIALLGVDAETGVFMLLYLDLAYDEAKREGRLRSLGDLQAAVLPGADVMKRIAAPMIGGIFTSFVLELVVYPAIYEIWKWHFGLKRQLALAPTPGAQL